MFANMEIKKGPLFYIHGGPGSKTDNSITKILIYTQII